MSKLNIPCHGGEQTKTGNPIIGDCVNYRSNDGAVEIVTKVTTAKRYPKHSYPIVCIRLNPREWTRIQKIPGSDVVEICLSHIETVQHLKALNSADAKCKYTWREIPEKSAERKEFWKRKIQQSWKNRRK